MFTSTGNGFIVLLPENRDRVAGRETEERM
jgi:hypothetical protein